MEYLLMYITCFFALITLLIDRKYIAPNEKTNEKILNEKIKIKNTLTGIEFVKNIFPANDILIQPAKKLKARGEYKVFTNKVIFTPSFKNNINFVDLTTALHEYKHKKDRIILIINTLITIFFLTHLLLVLISEKFFLGFTYAIIPVLIAMTIKGISEIRAVNYAKKEIHKYLDNSDKYKKKINNLAYRRNIGHLTTYILLTLIFSLSFLVIQKEGSLITLITNTAKIFS